MSPEAEKHKHRQCARRTATGAEVDPARQTFGVDDEDQHQHRPGVLHPRVAGALRASQRRGAHFHPRQPGGGCVCRWGPRRSHGIVRGVGDSYGVRGISPLGDAMRISSAVPVMIPHASAVPYELGSLAAVGDPIRPARSASAAGRLDAEIASETGGDIRWPVDAASASCLGSEP